MIRIATGVARLRLSTRPLSGRVKQSESLVLTKIDSNTGYAEVTLNRAPVNGLNLELLETLGNTMDNLEREKVKGMILTSFSDKVFCAGLDIRELMDPNAERLRSFWTALQNLWVKLYGSSFPTVAVVNGHAPAGGCFLAIACEFRIMRQNCTIGLNETALGITVPLWLQATMRNTIGCRKTELACTSGKLYNSQEALEIGLVDELVVDKHEAIERAINFLDKFRNISSQPRSRTKLLLRISDLDEFKCYREKDLERFISNTLNAGFQQELHQYFESLRSRK
ncbi:enoyl-CoA delta isomerase 1, mitochondrial-like [Topomyia yanbarensis]|uniref:enoyl-CoA delta isomerase 1, mitochondrial-like n=1 Tax=Topomyia yanbarensis TaxID=2498891 RepID=UPI00273C6083|nr:enoyl-CoA delta isomerase 1, mitochondrial-like [Topomyia yanbarensis]XP_058820015.1 enoyl-CoA delta isomerase 1, mitochondrial-like [Topomyia yanbarensis]